MEECLADAAATVDERERQLFGLCQALERIQFPFTVDELVGIRTDRGERSRLLQL